MNQPHEVGGDDGAGGAASFLEDLRHRVKPWVGAALVRSAEFGLLGGMPVDEQIDHALGFVHAFETRANQVPRAVLDLGSGGGVPGFILISCWPESRIVLIDANERRTEFLTAESTGHAAAGGVEVIRGRAEESGRNARLRDHFDLVTSRSFGAPAVAAECGAPFLAIGGAMIVSEPPDSDGADRWPPDQLKLVGLEPLTRVRFNDAYGYQVLVKSTETPDRYPRRTGIPAKRPLF